MSKELNKIMGMVCERERMYYNAAKVDALLADKDAEIAELKQKLEDVNELIKTARKMLEDAKATAYTESVDAGMRERRLKRALYKACANWADAAAFNETEGIGYDNSVAERWRKMESKCLKKAEEYK